MPKNDRFCPKCGAYIPHGETNCVSCGKSVNARESPGTDLDAVVSYINQHLKDQYVGEIVKYGVFTPGKNVKIQLTIIGTLK